LTILNGYKDDEYLRLALLGRKLERKMIVVVERFHELESLIKLSQEMNVEPLIGLRAKISVKGSGKWSESGGEKAKFGLSVGEIIKGIELLEKHNLKHTIKLLHFHIGSQVVNIQNIKDAINEGTRIYSELLKIGVPIDYMDVGGGLGVDYDGSQSAHDSSRNYSTEIYASDIVYGIKQVCDLAQVKHPHIVTESGRAMTAHHSVVITEVMDKIGPMTQEFTESVLEKTHILVKNIEEILLNVNETPYQEIFNDALSVKTDAENAFRLGILSLKEKAIIEDHFWEICRILKGKIKHMDFISEDFENFSDNLALQYLCNFSVFQSLPDSWAIDQLFPVVPISRLNELPTEHCVLVDITCDSDGKIDKFINLGKYKNTLQLHSLKKDEPYLLGFFLTGAYQDVMGDTHNLFGRLNEVHVFSDMEDPHNFYIEEIIQGASAKKVLNTMQYNAGQMAYNIKKEVDSFVGLKKINARESVRLIDFFEECLNGYTYLRGKEEA
jgi:arginine decarboxylase